MWDFYPFVRVLQNNRSLSSEIIFKPQRFQIEDVYFENFKCDYLKAKNLTLAPSGSVVRIQLWPFTLDK